MSLIRCDGRGNLIDSDIDPDCFIEDPKSHTPKDIVMCITCRGELYDIEAEFKKQVTQPSN